MAFLMKIKARPQQATKKRKLYPLATRKSLVEEEKMDEDWRGKETMAGKTKKIVPERMGEK